MWKLPAIPYALEPQPYLWGEITSTLNWCEEDYIVTTYCAEFINSLTNLMFIYVSCRGIWSGIKNGHAPVFIVAWASLLIVGFGSFLFHATLWYSMQLVDELSMILTTLVMWFATFSYKQSRLFSTVLGLLLIFVLLTVSLTYHYLGNPIFHQNVYALLTLVVITRSWYLVHTRVRKVSPRDYKVMKQLVGMGLGCMGAAFALWNVDTKWCGRLRGWRREIGMPWGFVLEGHGHWHLLSGVGGYYIILYGIYLRTCLDNAWDEYEFIWPSIWTSLPSISKRAVRLDGKVANGAAPNGITRKAAARTKKEL